jgi:coenzyme F420 hydrogenase subunit beta
MTQGEKRSENGAPTAGDRSLHNGGWSGARTVADIASWRLCLGCGACASVCPDHRVRLVDFTREGYRPVVAEGDCRSCAVCLQVCPAFVNDRSEANSRPGIIPELTPYCGPALEIWEGHATDPEIRFMGSSGGLITALSMFCLEVEKMHGVLHTAGNPEVPWQNRTRLSRTRSELMAATGSRYAPAAVCDSLGLVENAPAPCLVVGQPSEITALRKAQQIRPQLAQKVGLAISFFCAGSPSTEGTLRLLKKLDIDPAAVAEVRYRGRGWPGHFGVRLKGQTEFIPKLTYAESWGFIQEYRPFSVHLCPDGTGEDADITCGDPWYRQVQPGEPGSSLILIRTELGRRMFRRAVEAGHIVAKPLGIAEVLKSQHNLFEKRGAVGGRILTMKLFGLPTPDLRGFSLFRNWLRLPFANKLRSTLGTARRIISRRLYRPLALNEGGGLPKINGGEASTIPPSAQARSSGALGSPASKTRLD